jgi:hypothetical protein
MNREEAITCALWGAWAGLMALGGWVAGGLFF